MYTKIYPNSKISRPPTNNYININNIFKQINTNIITPNQPRRRSMQGQNKNVHNHNASFVDNNSNLNKNYKKQLFLNGTLETEDSDSIANQTQMTQMYQRTNINNNYKTNNKENKSNNNYKTQLNRYNSYGRMKPLNNNNNGAKNNKTPLKNKKKVKGNNNFAKIIPNGKNSNITNRALKKNVFIPLGNNSNNNKFHTIADNKSNGYSNFNNNINKTQIREHNTIEAGKVNLYNQIMLKKYSTNRPNGNNTNYNKINYNFINIKNNRDKSNERKKVYRERPKTPDHMRMEKSSNNRKPKTPDRQRTKRKFNLNKEYFCPTMENVDYFGNKNHYNNGITNNNNNTTAYRLSSGYNTIDNYFDNKYQLTQDVCNKDYNYNYNFNDNLNTLTSNNSNANRRQNKSKPKSRRTSSGRCSNPNTNSNGNNNTMINNNNKTKRRTLTKNASQGNIRHADNHYYLITNTNNNNNYNNNGNQYMNMNKTRTNNGNKSHSKTPEKTNGTKSKFSGVSVPMTQLKEKNTYGIYGDTFQSFGKKIPTVNELNNRGKNFDYNNKYLYECNKKNQQNQNYIYNNVYPNVTNNNKLDKIKSPLTNIFSLPTSNKKQFVQKDFSSVCSEMMSGSTIGSQMKESYSNEIDFNEMDQFSPPYASGQVNLTGNPNCLNNKQIQNQYTNIGIANENNKNGFQIKENISEGNRKVIDDFIKQLGNKGQSYL